MNELGTGKLLGDTTHVRRQAEIEMGVRCGGCGERIHSGRTLFRLDPQVTPQGQVAMAVGVANACDREECGFDALQIEQGAFVAVAKEVEWLDEADQAPERTFNDSPSGTLGLEG